MDPKSRPMRRGCPQNGNIFPACSSCILKRQKMPVFMEEEDPFCVGVIVIPNRKPSGTGGSRRKDCNEGTKPGRSPSGTENDHEYGCRKCFDRTGSQRQMHECGNGLCDRNPLYRRCVPCHSVRRCRCVCGRRKRKCHHTDRCGRLYQPDGSEHQYGSFACIHSL